MLNIQLSTGQYSSEGEISNELYISHFINSLFFALFERVHKMRKIVEKIVGLW